MRQAIQIAAMTILVCVASSQLLRAEAPEKNDPSEVTQACLECHETPKVMGIMKTAHAKAENGKTPAATEQCQSCHGPSLNHIMFPMQVENVHFGKTSSSPPEKQNANCLQCHHNDRDRESRKASAHGYEKVVCSECHSMHDPDEVVPARTDVKATCTSVGCHDTLLKESRDAQYTHAIGKSLGDKGQLTCSGCHNPHGPLESSRCLDCHPQTPEVLAKQSEKAKRFHEVAETKGTGCIRCHKGLAHRIAPLPVAESHAGMERPIHD